MKKSIFLTILLLLTSVFSSLASEENTTAGMYISGLNQLYITADAKGTYSFLLENAREKAQLCPGGNYRALSKVCRWFGDQKQKYIKMCAICVLVGKNTIKFLNNVIRIL